MRGLVTSLLLLGCARVDGPPTRGDDEPGPDGDIETQDSDGGSDTDAPRQANTCPEAIDLTMLAPTWGLGLGERPAYVTPATEGRYALVLEASYLSAPMRIHVVEPGVHLGDPTLVFGDTDAFELDFVSAGPFPGLDAASPLIPWVRDSGGQSARWFGVDLDARGLASAGFGRDLAFPRDAWGLPVVSVLDIVDVDVDGDRDVVAWIIDATPNPRMVVYRGPFESPLASRTPPSDGLQLPPYHFPIGRPRRWVGDQELDVLVQIQSEDGATAVGVVEGPFVGPGVATFATTIDAGPDGGDPFSLKRRVAVGDFDGDGAEDLAIGRPSDIGAVDVYRGPLPAGALKSTDAWATFVGTDPTQSLGHLLAVVDLDGDGRDDLLASRVDIDRAPLTELVPEGWSAWIAIGPGARDTIDLRLDGVGGLPWIAADPVQPVIALGDPDGDGDTEVALRVSEGVLVLTPCPIDAD